MCVWWRGWGEAKSCQNTSLQALWSLAALLPQLSPLLVALCIGGKLNAPLLVDRRHISVTIMDANQAASVTRSKPVSAEFAKKHLDAFLKASTGAAAGTQGAGVRISTDTAHQLHLMVQALGELQQ